MSGRALVAATPAALAVLLAGCATPEPVTVIKTEVVEKPVPVHCKVHLPAECRDRYAVDRLDSQDDDVTINRALRAEIEERAACEARLRAAVDSCGK